MVVRSLAPSVLSRGSRRGQNPREAPLVRLRDAPDTQVPPAPLRWDSAAGQWNIREQNTCPSSQCRLSFALFNLCICKLGCIVCFAGFMAFQAPLRRMKLSGCPAVLAVFREGGPCFLKSCC